MTIGEKANYITSLSVFQHSLLFRYIQTESFGILVLVITG